VKYEDHDSCSHTDDVKDHIEFERSRVIRADHDSSIVRQNQYIDVYHETLRYILSRLRSSSLDLVTRAHIAETAVNDAYEAIWCGKTGWLPGSTEYTLSTTMKTYANYRLKDQLQNISSKRRRQGEMPIDPLCQLTADVKDVGANDAESIPCSSWDDPSVMIEYSNSIDVLLTMVRKDGNQDVSTLLDAILLHGFDIRDRESLAIHLGWPVVKLDKVKLRLKRHFRAVKAIIQENIV